jgi:LacI family transcriptional regulator
VIITPIGNITPPLARLQERGTPVVLVDRLAGLDRFSSVSVDDVLGGRLAARHLIERGRKRIAFVGPTDLEQFAGRRRGARLAVEQTSGVSFEQIATPVPSFLAGRQAAERILHRTPARRPDGICTVNDLVALGILQELLVAGVRVPEEIAVIGYDDIAFAGSAVVALSSIRQPRELLGRTGVELLLEEAREGTNFTHRHVVFQPELVARASTIGAAADQPRTSD